MLQFVHIRNRKRKYYQRNYINIKNLNIFPFLTYKIKRYSLVDFINRFDE